nr:MAG TPA: head tail connector [Caudoviricetes sp.]
MKQVKKIGELTYEDVANYIRISELDDTDINFINMLIEVSKAYICKYTGRTLEELDRYSDMVIVMYVLCQDMYDNRTLYVNNDSVNKVVSSILDMYSVNLL